MSEPVNILSFDIEEWFHPEIFAGRYSPKQWNSLESRVVGGTELIFNFLAKKKLKATFFFLGWVAEKYPALVKTAVEEGHEIGSHGFSHRMVTRMSPEEFRADLQKSLVVLNNLSDRPVRGFRAPTFSITQKSLWALPILLDAGIRYDSSVFPIYHDRYGIPDAPIQPYPIYQREDDVLTEFPMTTVRFGKYNFPCSGGGYFRLFPFTLSLKLMKRCQRERRTIIFYAHPWEFDTGLPKINLGFLGKMRHYKGIDKFLQRLDIITDMFPFTSFREAYPQQTS